MRFPFIKNDAIQKIEDLPVWRPGRAERLLLFAPHPDDEILAGGGVIALMLEKNPAAAIKVVVATNGDASRLSALWQGYPPFSVKNLRRLALKRQQESLSALIFLGLHAEQIHYWGFPDQGLAAIWEGYWDNALAYRSPTTGHSNNAQAMNSLPTPYTSLGLLRLLQDALDSFQPTTILIPHPQDAHPDHAALAHFIALAVALKSIERHFAPPTLLAYAVWLRGAPFPTSIRLGKGRLNLPANFNSPRDKWLRFSLAPGIKQKKRTALQCYRSQKLSAGSVLRDSSQSDYEVFDAIQANSVFPPYTKINIPFAAKQRSRSYGSFMRWAKERLAE